MNEDAGEDEAPPSSNRYWKMKDERYVLSPDCKMDEAMARVRSYDKLSFAEKFRTFTVFISHRVSWYEKAGIEAALYELQAMIQSDEKVMNYFKVCATQTNNILIQDSLYQFILNAPFLLIQEFFSQSGLCHWGRCLHSSCSRYIQGDQITYLLYNYFKNDDQNLLDEKDSSGQTPLHIACVSGHHLDIVRFLIEKGANVNSKNRMGYTPIHYAAEIGFEEIIKILYTAKADLNVEDNARNTPLHLACKKSMYQSVLALVDAGADLSVFIGENSPWRFIVPWRRVPFGQGSRTSWIKWVSKNLILPICWNRAKIFLEGRADKNSVLSCIPPELVQLFVTVFTDAISAEFVSCSKKKSLQRFYKEDLPSTGWDYEIMRSKPKS